MTHRPALLVAALVAGCTAHYPLHTEAVLVAKNSCAVPPAAPGALRPPSLGPTSIASLIADVRQDKANDCALIGIAKAAIALFGADCVFAAMTEATDAQGQPQLRVTMRDDVTVTLSRADLDQAQRYTQLQLGEDTPHAQLLRTWINLFAAAAFQRVAQQSLRPTSVDAAARRLVEDGLSYAQAPQILGLRRHAVCGPTHDHANTVSFLQSNAAALAVSPKHIRFSSWGVVDEHGHIDGIWPRVWNGLALRSDPAPFDPPCLKPE